VHSLLELAITSNYRNLGSYRRSASRLFPPFADLNFRAVDVSQSLPKIARMSAASPKSQRGTSARYGARLLYLDCVRRSQSLSSGGMSRTFFAASARSIAFSAATTASDLIAA